MGMGGHDDKGVYPQRSLLVTEVKAFAEDETRFGGDENRQPVNDSKGEIVEGNSFLDTIYFHERIITRRRGKGYGETPTPAHDLAPAEGPLKWKTSPEQGTDTGRIVSKAGNLPIDNDAE